MSRKKWVGEARGICPTIAGANGPHFGLPRPTQIYPGLRQRSRAGAAREEDVLS